MQTMHLRSLKYPAAFLALAVLMLIPSYFVFADENGGEGKCRPESQGDRPGVAVNVVSVSVSQDGSGTIQATLTRVPDEVTQEQGVDDGTSVTISVTQETKYVLDGKETSAADLDLGEEVFVKGEVDMEGRTISARFITDHLPQPRFHVGEVVQVDTSANTILVKAMRPKDDGQEAYVYITYTDETVINEDGEKVDESAIEVGDKIHAEGDVNEDSDKYLAEITAKSIHLFEEQTPREVKREHRQDNEESHSDIRE